MSTSQPSYVYYAKVTSRRKHKDGAIDLSIAVIGASSTCGSCMYNMATTPDFVLVEPPSTVSTAAPYKFTPGAPPATIGATSASLMAVVRLKPSTKVLPSGVPSDLHRSLMTAGSHIIVATNDRLPERDKFCSIATHAQVVSVTPSSSALAHLLSVAASLPQDFVDQLLTPNTSNFPRNIRAPALSPRPPNPIAGLYPLSKTPKQHLTLLLNQSHRSKLPALPPLDMQMLLNHFEQLQPAAAIALPTPKIPPCVPTNLLFTSASSPSAHGATTRQSYLNEKKLPQLYSLFSLLPCPMPCRPMRILDVGGGRSDLCINLLHHLRVNLNRKGDRIVVLDNNAPSLESGLLSANDPAVTFVRSNFAEYLPEELFDVTIGLHPCGSLSDQILMRAPGFTLHTILLVPCCYSKCRAELGSTWLEGFEGGEKICKMCERNEDEDVSTKAMAIVNELRLRHHRNRYELDAAFAWKWKVASWDRAFSKKNAILIGTRDDRACHTDESLLACEACVHEDERDLAVVD